jgi:hypothetical protein
MPEKKCCYFEENGQVELVCSVLSGKISEMNVEQIEIFLREELGFKKTEKINLAWVLGVPR